MLTLLRSNQAVLRDALPKALNAAVLLIGAADMVTPMPPLTDVGAIFGLGIIALYLWARVMLLRLNSQKTGGVSFGGDAPITKAAPEDSAHHSITPDNTPLKLCG